MVDPLGGKALCRLPRTSSAAVFSEDLASGVEQSNVVELLGGKALCRLPRTNSAAVFSEDQASGVEQSNVVELLGGKALCRGSVPTPADELRCHLLGIGGPPLAGAYNGLPGLIDLPPLQSKPLVTRSRRAPCQVARVIDLTWSNGTPVPSVC